ncbi:ISNCY family transposase, partial [Acidimicrobium ferrooxidans]|nr:ISNCY family transposase [Acidimicrobium ferrooxidans]
RVARDRIADSLYLREFAGFGWHRIPTHQAFQQAVKKLRPATIERINAILIRDSVEREIEDGDITRTDTTVVECNVRPPTDSGLLCDCVRVLSRETARFGAIHHGLTVGFKPNRLRRARRLAYRINQAARKRGEAKELAMKDSYSELVTLTEEVAQQCLEVVKRAKSIRIGSSTQAERTHRRIERVEHFIVITMKVIDQTKRRVFKGESLPASEKIYSIFETHTALIKRGKINKRQEYGRKLALSDTPSGIITFYEVLEGNPNDSGQLIKALDQHKRIFGFVPTEFSADRGYYSAKNIEHCKANGIEVISVPKPGYLSKSQKELQRDKRFKAAQKRRAGIEGKISVLKRGRGLTRCMWRTDASFQLFVGLGIITQNLLTIARHLLE